MNSEYHYETNNDTNHYTEYYETKYNTNKSMKSRESRGTLGKTGDFVSINSHMYGSPNGTSLKGSHSQFRSRSSSPNPDMSVPDENNRLGTESIYLNHNDISNPDFPYAQKVDTILPNGIKDSLPNLKKNPGNGLQLKINNQFWETNERDKQYPTVTASEFFTKEGLLLYEKCVVTLEQKKIKKFEDDFFPPVMSSLVPNTLSMTKPIWREIKWVRMCDLYKNHTMVLADMTTTPADILRGSFLDDLYIANGLSALAEFPQLVGKIFEGQKVNEFGIYKVRLYDNGEPKDFVIDDFIPCVETSTGLVEPAFVQPRVQSKNKVDIWPHLVMKAWAKMNGCYNNIIHGLTDEFITDVTAISCDRVNIFL